MVCSSVVTANSWRDTLATKVRKTIQHTRIHTYTHTHIEREKPVMQNNLLLPTLCDDIIFLPRSVLRLLSLVCFFKRELSCVPFPSLLFCFYARDQNFFLTERTSCFSSSCTCSELVADCYDCCAEEKTFSNVAVKYVSAVLEICN